MALVHDAGTGRLLATLDNAKAHAAELAEIAPEKQDRPDLWQVAFSADGTRVLTGCSDDSLRVWDAGSGALLRSIHGAGKQIALSPDGRLAALAAPDGSVRVLEAGEWSERFHVPARSARKELCLVAFSPDSAWLALGGEDGGVRLVEMATAGVIETGAAHTAGIRDLIFSPDSRHLLTAAR